MKIAIGKRGRKPIIPELEICGMEEHLCPVCNCYVPESTLVCPGCGERFLKPDEHEPMRVTPKELDEMIQRRKRFVAKAQWNMKLEIQKLEQAQMDCQNTKKTPEPTTKPAAPTPSPAKRTATPTPKPVYSEPEVKGEQMDERTWIWLGTLLLSLILFILVYSATMSHRDTSPVVTATPTPIPAIEDLEILDYVDVYKHREEYEGQQVVVAGQISYFSDAWTICFSERFAFEDASSGFRANFYQDSSRKKVSDSYSVGQYVIVKGTVTASSRFQDLNEASILYDGRNAKVYVDAFTEQWHEQGQAYAETLPLTDYMDVIDDPNAYIGQRIRTVGQVQNAHTNWSKANSTAFRFRSRETNFAEFSVDLFGCPEAMQALCKENDYVLLSGVVIHNIHGLRMIDCYVECVGEEAEALSLQSAADWKIRWDEKRELYISECEESSYEHLARYPDQYDGSQITVSGRVVKIDVGLSWDSILLDVGDGDLMYVRYSGKQYRDPEILKNDRITFYGEYLGKQNYAVSEKEDEHLPYLVAQYSSINS